MPASVHSPAAQHPIGVSSAGGGIAQQFRVQYQEASDQLWHLHATYRSQEKADACARSLEAKGVVTRVVRYSICPASM